MKITIIGTGYVGLVTGVCFAEMGTTVECIDSDIAKIDALQAGRIPIYEPGLAEMAQRNQRAGRLRFSTDITEHLGLADVIFIAVGTPPSEDGSADLSHVLEVATTLGRTLDHEVIVVVKSTVPVGTTERVRTAIESELHARGATFGLHIASNPEFLKEGNAVANFMMPDRIVVGTASAHAREVLHALYAPFMRSADRMIFTDIASAEMIKYASNAMLATRISFMNDIANVCEKVGADINMVRRGMGADERIGHKFLYAGCGYGGSCFPKDVKALIHTAAHVGYDMLVLRAVEAVNNRQKQVLFEKLCHRFGDTLCERRIAVWGLAFKPETDDMREAPSVELLHALLDAQCRHVSVYDPAATDNCRRLFGEQLHYADDMYAAAQEADALVIVTEWKEFRLPQWERLAQSMRGRVVVDGRNLYPAEEVRKAGFEYFRIG